MVANLREQVVEQRIRPRDPLVGGQVDRFPAG
jgi:hypothetical protein